MSLLNTITVVLVNCKIVLSNSIPRGILHLALIVRYSFALLNASISGNVGGSYSADVNCVVNCSAVIVVLWLDVLYIELLWWILLSCDLMCCDLLCCDLFCGDFICCEMNCCDLLWWNSLCCDLLCFDLQYRKRTWLCLCSTVISCAVTCFESVLVQVMQWCLNLWLILMMLYGNGLWSCLGYELSWVGVVQNPMAMGWCNDHIMLI